jgi:hypothetical protein
MGKRVAGKEEGVVSLAVGMVPNGQPGQPTCGAQKPGGRLLGF